MNLDTVADQDAAPDAVRHRDADGTRQRLLGAARLRFARDGYAAATVRDIAADAGVNVALINRYFVSKEGLFAACLQGAVKQLDDRDADASNIDQMVRAMVEQVTESPNSDHPLQMLLLLRSSGDADADRIRRDTLYQFARRMADAAGWAPEDLAETDLVLRAQLVLSTALGILLLRSSTALEPINSATTADLEGPVGDLVRAMLAPPTR